MELRKELSEKSCDAILLNDLAEIAWLFNMRGSDVDCNPVFVAYALVDTTGAALFLHKEQVTEAVAAHLAEANVTVREYSEVRAAAVCLEHAQHCFNAVMSCMPARAAAFCTPPVCQTSSESARDGLLTQPPLCIAAHGALNQ